MAYRRTERETARLAARYEAIMAAARAVARESGLAAVQIAPVAERASIAAGTVYRYFPSKHDLVAALVSATTDREVVAIRAAAALAPGALSGLAAAIVVFASGTIRARRLAWALLGETVEGGEVRRSALRRTVAGEFERLIRTAIAAGQLPSQSAATTAAAIVGAIVESLVGPLAPAAAGPDAERNAVQGIALFALRALGVADARARGLVISAISSADQRGRQPDS
jgi:AcrR family transcriptional regulator